MEAWYFTEMPYPHLPPQDSYPSDRVSLSNAHYDPEIGADLYNRYLDEYIVADELGLNLMLNEHHQTPTCLDAAVPLTAAILARETSKGRILVLGNPVANRADPVRIAEEMAMVDCISRGRLDMGLVRGSPYEIAPTNAKPVGQMERFWEAHDLIIKALSTRDEPFSWMPCRLPLTRLAWMTLGSPSVKGVQVSPPSVDLKMPVPAPPNAPPSRKLCCWGHSVA